ncbi:MAG: hypothetical protein HPY53_05935 [Brevinematales bacterium]|nr:hypothetical protein [Brevinematales bacterium]
MEITSVPLAEAPVEEKKPRGIINPDELVFDILLIASALFFRGAIIPAGKSVLDLMTPWVLIPVLFIGAFVLTMSYGQLNRRYRTLTAEKSAPRKLAAVFFIILTVFSIGSLIAFFSKIAFLYVGEGVFILCGLFLLPMTGVIGAVYGNMEDAGSKKIFTGIILLTLTAVIGLYAVFRLHPVLHGFVNGFVAEQFQGSAGYIVLIVLLAVLVTFYILMWPVFQKVFDYFYSDGDTLWSKVREIIKHVLISALLIGSIFIIQELMVTWGVRAAEMKTGPAFSIAPLFFFGLIPVRVLTMFAPPIRVISLITGAAAVGIYLYMLIAYLPQLRAIFG